ncbi:hypothetical protein COCNU_scaffold005805G000020 [Cocos nucifera]|nr:hypothetical protein [Cocos nucifera]
MKVGALSSMVPIVSVTSTKVALDVEAPPATEVSVVSVDSLPPASSSLHARGQASEPPIEREKGDDKKKKKSAIVKIVHKAHQAEPNDGGDNLGEDPFENPKIIQDLTDKYAMLEMVDRMSNLDQTQFIWSSLGTFLKEDPDEEVGPSDVMADPTPIEPTYCPPESAMEMSKPTQKLEAVKSIPTSSTTTSPKVEGLK